MTRSSVRQRACGGLLALGLLVAPGLLCAQMPATAWAGGLSGSAIVEYSPQAWPFAVSASGPGQLELREIRTRGPSSDEAEASKLVVRDGTAELQVALSQVLVFRLVPDEGASVASVRVGGEDASSAVGADGTFVLAAEDARDAIEVTFAASAADAGEDAGMRRVLGSLARTGDLPWIGVFALTLAALCAFCAARCADGRRGNNEVPPRESA